MLYESFNSICKLRSNYLDKNGEPEKFRTDHEKARLVIERLQSFKLLLEDKLTEKIKKYNLEIKISVGASEFPIVWHVCILPPEQRVSKGIYVAICFDKLGRGALIGCAESKTESQGLSTVVRKKKDLELKIDVDGGSTKTHYNNCFLNPREFYLKESFNNDDEIALINHIDESLALVLYTLDLGEMPENATRGMVNASNDDPEFGTPEKVYRMIAARRGQKKFRDALLKAYKNTCAISGCRFDEILEAAHIIPYSESGARHSIVTNGILLRADLHTLFDLNLLKIHPGTLKVELDPILAQDASYANLSDKKISLPSNKEDWPEYKYLNKKYFG